jgi:predicted phage baseplate assembly protein
MNGAVVPPHTSSRRAALLEQLIVALTSDPQTALPIKTRAPDDPTIALLDAWATVGDVLGFYLDRIADEGYLTTALQPSSVLALASLVGYRPVPGLAAQGYLAYTLGPDPADGAVQFSPGLLFQSMPGPGQQPQTFESTQPIVARPSWNLMNPRSTRPVQPSDTSLVVDGTAANLSPNDVILLTAYAGQYPVTVASATVDYTAKVTNVTLQAAADGSLPAPTSPSDHTENATTAMDTLLKTNLGKPTTPVPKSANQLKQTAQSVFTAGSDAVPRLISALQPAIASKLYAALSSTAIGLPPVTGASVMQVTAAPFGAAAPPQTVFNASGQPVGTRDWPIGDTFTLTLSLTRGGLLRSLETVMGTDHPHLKHLRLFDHQQREVATENLVMDVQWNVARFTSHAAMEISGGSGTASPTPPFFGDVTLSPVAGGKVQLACKAGPPAGSPSPLPPSTPSLTVTAGLGPDPGAITFEFTSGGKSLGSLVWVPTANTPFNGQVGDTQVTIEWSQTSPDAQAVLTLSIATPLPPTQPNVLLLDATYPQITAPSYVVIDSAPSSGAPSSSSSSSSSSPSSSSSSSSLAPSNPSSSSSSSSSGASSSSSSSSSSAITYPVVAQVISADTVAASGYGITGQVTQLTLAPGTVWLDPSAVSQAALRPLTVYAQPAALPLQPAPATDDVAQSSIDLDVLVAGMEPGRLIAVTGTRADLPGAATVQSGEIAMVASVSTTTDNGDTPYSTLTLANPLAYSYQRSTVQIYGNVVSAHQGATINQVLGSGQPAQAPQSFTLNSGPLLADPAPTASGYRSSLTVTVDGVGYTQVDRVDNTTPAQSFVVGTNASGQTTVVFPAPLPAGTGNVSASYRAGNGSQGNLSAGQVKQLLSRPASLSSVTNPLPATGGTGGDDQESVRAAAPVSLSGLGRLVTVSDYADLARAFAGVGKANAVGTPGTGVVVTLAGTDPTQPFTSGDSTCLAVTAAIAAEADPTLQVQVLPADLYLIALTAQVAHDPKVSWDVIVAAVRAALLAKFGYAQRGLGQNVAVSDLQAAAHRATGVWSFTVTGLALVPAAATATQLSDVLPALLSVSPVPPVATLASVPGNWKLQQTPPVPAAVAYLSDSVPGTLILSEESS